MSYVVEVSPRHSIALSDDYRQMIETAPREDFVVRTLARRKAGEMTLMMGELVIAGDATRKTYELACNYPLHFRKTYYPGRMHGDPRHEFAMHARASEVVGIPAPIGATRDTFRSCFLPGTPLNRLSELGTEPDESNIKLAQELSLVAAVGLWRLLEDALEQLTTLQASGLSHGDAHLHNFIVCPSPLQVFPIDFEIARLQDSMSTEDWIARCQSERQYLLRMAVFLQCRLGQGEGPLALQSNHRLDELVKPAKTFRKTIAERSFEAHSKE